MPNWQSITDHIGEAIGEPFSPATPRSVGGGCINSSVKLQDAERTVFVKFNRGALLDMFEAESSGLDEMAATGTIRTPQPYCSGVVDGQAYLAMEYLELGRSGSAGAVLAGRQLAEMHRTVQSAFGWWRDNTIGSTFQSNTPDENWTLFWQRRRLGFQLELAGRNGHGGALQRMGERLLSACPALLDHSPKASLLHGDLWGGNLAYDLQGNPVIFDPAVYFGDREADLAMTELFGGFGGDFYAAYHEAWPLDPGYSTRKTFYNLFHILNHLNLFGGGYLGQASGMMERLLAELG
ncbi:MAG: hypothetical protein DIZ77_05695 [endosymbiont of Seepiophila jonesi]|uniref:Fructosamine kinase family protein n=1 Tax=endosymbiont of Lamellibrachia luymesi TaxID=2200907 RepID=A0A370DU42_9GAMM|nr:MAG: hypothetical protein DIZ79_14545 [endosymbiont of Lamellibrachia luymesi]RDH93584.1 MAG: hypothetical protein DIZ77_05695 [endosymbiont of Seepiophila jonesi]